MLRSNIFIFVELIFIININFSQNFPYLCHDPLSSSRRLYYSQRHAYTRYCLNPISRAFDPTESLIICSGILKPWRYFAAINTERSDLSFSPVGVSPTTYCRIPGSAYTPCYIDLEFSEHNLNFFISFYPYKEYLVIRSIMASSKVIIYLLCFMHFVKTMVC